MNVMNEQFTKQAEDFVRAAQQAGVPENLQAFAQESVAKTRDAYERLACAAAEGTKAFEAVANEAQSAVKTVFGKVVSDWAANAQAAFDAAEAMARAKSFPEVAKVQADFFQAQMVKVGEQTRELLEMSAKAATQTFGVANATATKPAETGKRAGKR